MNENAWRATLATLADDRTRDIYARLVLRLPVDEALAALPAK